MGAARKKTSELMRAAAAALVAHGCDIGIALQLSIRAGILEVFHSDAIRNEDTDPSRRSALICIEEGRFPGELDPEALT